MSYYAEFLTTKRRAVERIGHDLGAPSPLLYDFQAAIVRWAVRLGRAAVFADCGLGKTRMQIEWARHSGERALIVAPLSVAEQTVAEGAALGVEVRHVARPSGAPGIEITNYEKLAHFDAAAYDAIVLDESSILKAYDGKTRTRLIQDFGRIPRRLCCTATPAPNDIAELANHAEFLGAATRVEMLATYFVHDDDGWRLKGHAADAFYEWLAEWSVYVRRPSDLGFDDARFELPPLAIRDDVVALPSKPQNGALFPMLGGVGSRAQIRRDSMDARVERAAEIIRADAGNQWIVWCGLNDEQHAIAKALGDECVSVEGKTPEDARGEMLRRWSSGAARILVSKPAIFGFGMNLQFCARMLFLGIGDSYEAYYQAVRRCWRYGQTREVEAVIVVSDVESGIAANVRRKEAEAARTAEAVVGVMRNVQTRRVREVEGERVTTPGWDKIEIGEGYQLMLGDCVERLRDVGDASVGLSVFSPPFAALYTYSASDRDMGNCRDYDEFFRHFGFFIPELLRVTMPGRRAAVHVAQVTTTAATHGVIGWRDFRADVVRAFIAAGWVYDGEVVIDKDPQAQAIRTKSKALMFVQKARDASWLRPAMADYILLFRHPGTNAVPVHGDVTNEEWIAWARPIWYGIDESDTLNVAEARTDRDERHICPLQLPVIERCVRLWTNPGETVLSPFAGIGSEGVVALRRGRRFVGVELKEAYWRVAAKNLANATRQIDLPMTARACPPSPLPVHESPTCPACGDGYHPIGEACAVGRARAVTA